jgi:hypothetical protein
MPSNSTLEALCESIEKKEILTVSYCLSIIGVEVDLYADRMEGGTSPMVMAFESGEGTIVRALLQYAKKNNAVRPIGVGNKMHVLAVVQSVVDGYDIDFLSLQQFLRPECFKSLYSEIVGMLTIKMAKTPVVSSLESAEALFLSVGEIFRYAKDWEKLQEGEEDETLAPFLSSLMILNMDICLNWRFRWPVDRYDVFDMYASDNRKNSMHKHLIEYFNKLTTDWNKLDLLRCINVKLYAFLTSFEAVYLVFENFNKARVDKLKADVIRCIGSVDDVAFYSSIITFKALSVGSNLKDATIEIFNAAVNTGNLSTIIEAYELPMLGRSQYSQGAGMRVSVDLYSRFIMTLPYAQRKDYLRKFKTAFSEEYPGLIKRLTEALNERVISMSGDERSVRARFKRYEYDIEMACLLNAEGGRDPALSACVFECVVNCLYDYCLTGKDDGDIRKAIDTKIRQLYDEQALFIVAKKSVVNHIVTQ